MSYQMPRQFSKKELKIVRRSQRKHQAEIQKLCDSLDTSNVADPTWNAFAKPSCASCHGRGVATYNHPKTGEYKLPCECSVRAKAKATGNFKNKAVWSVIKGGVETKVYAPSRYENE